MDRKLNLSQLTDLFCEKSGISKSVASVFVRSFFETIVEQVSAGEQVRVKGFGTFKQTVIKDRESVNVNTGERIVIPGHTKVTFTPDSELKELINKPFANFETLILDAQEPVGKPVDSDDVQELVVQVPEPDMVPEPEIVPEPETTPEPEVTPEPETTPEPEVTPESEITSEPEAVPEPEATPEAEAASVSADLVSEDRHVHKPVKTKSPVIKILVWIIALILALLLISYLIWPVSLLHIFRMEENRLGVTDDSGYAVPVEQVEIVHPDSISDVVSEVCDSDGMAITGDTSRQVDAKTVSEAEIPAKEEAVRQNTVAKASSEFKMSAADEAKALDAYTMADTVMYRMSGVKTTHTLASGETLARVSLQYYGTKKFWPYIAAYNHISDTKYLQAGQKLKIPVLTNK